MLLTVGVVSIIEPEVEYAIDVCAAVDVVGFMPTTELIAEAFSCVCD